MTELVVRHGTVTDALGRKQTGWVVLENGMVNGMCETKEAAVKRAEGIAYMRRAGYGPVPVRVIEGA